MPNDSSNTLYVPPVDLEDSQQNAFVQNYLAAMLDGPGLTESDGMAIDHIIELVQETYNETDHRLRVLRDRHEGNLR